MVRDQNGLAHNNLTHFFNSKCLSFSKCLFWWYSVLVQQLLFPGSKYAALLLESWSQRYSKWLLIYLLTPWCRVLLDKLTGLQLVKKFPAFHWTRTFITALTSIRHLSLSWASPIQSIYPHPTSCRSILILSTHLRLGLPSGLLPAGFPTKTLYGPNFFFILKPNVRKEHNQKSEEYRGNLGC